MTNNQLQGDVLYHHPPQAAIPVNESNSLQQLTFRTLQKSLCGTIFCAFSSFISLNITCSWKRDSRQRRRRQQQVFLRIKWCMCVCLIYHSNRIISHQHPDSSFKLALDLVYYMVGSEKGGNFALNTIFSNSHHSKPQASDLIHLYTCISLLLHRPNIKHYSKPAVPAVSHQSEVKN